MGLHRQAAGYERFLWTANAPQIGDFLAVADTVPTPARGQGRYCAAPVRGITTAQEASTTLVSRRQVARGGAKSRCGRRLVVGFVCCLLASMVYGIARAIDAQSLGKLGLIVTVKRDSGAVRPLVGADFDLTCTTPVTFSVRLRTDDAGHANTFARPGKCLLTSRASVRIDSKSYSWRGNVELLRGLETRLELSNDNAAIQEGAEPPSGEGPSVPGPPDDVGSDQPTDPTSEVALPVVIFKVEPIHPPRAREDRIRGTVVCQAVVGDDGYVRDVKVLSSTNPIFNAASMRAVSQRRYLPAQRSGRAIAIYFTVRVDFKVF